jgi:hypothetical protein
MYRPGWCVTAQSTQPHLYCLPTSKFSISKCDPKAVPPPQIRARNPRPEGKTIPTNFNELSINDDSDRRVDSEYQIAKIGVKRVKSQSFLYFLGPDFN